MASKRQIEANRENAKRSTGPRTSMGKAASGRNARRHGLTSMTSEETLGRIGADIARAFGDDLIVKEVAHAQASLCRIRDARMEMLRALLDEPSLAALKRIANLERYERVARAKRKRVLRSLMPTR